MNHFPLADLARFTECCPRRRPTVSAIWYGIGYGHGSRLLEQVKTMSGPQIAQGEWEGLELQDERRTGLGAILLARHYVPSFGEPIIRGSVAFNSPGLPRALSRLENNRSLHLRHLRRKIDRGTVVVGEVPNALSINPFVVHRFCCEATSGATNGMRSRPSNRGFIATAGASIALAALFCGWPSKADAGCSHDGIVANDSKQLTHRLEILEIVERGVVPGQAPARPKPCSGALCSRVPVVPAALPITPGRSAEAIVPGPHAPPARSATGQLMAYAERIARDDIEKAAIERPPR